MALLLVAELLRNTGKFTMGDVLSFRMRQRPVRAAAAISTLVVSLFYLLAQMAGAGGLVALLLQIPTDDKVGQGVVIAVVGVLMIVYVLVGGMKGTTWVQIIKAVLLIVGAAVHDDLGAGHVRLQPLRRCSARPPRSRRATEGVAKRDVLGAGPQYGATVTSQIDFISLALALVLGTAGLPHVLMRFYTVPTAKEARRSVVWAIWLIGAVLPVHARARLRRGRAGAARHDHRRARRSELGGPLLAFELGGELLLGLISAIAFATILAVVAGLTITASASFAHDVYATCSSAARRRRGRRCGSPGSPRSWSAMRRDRPAASWPTGRTSRSSWRWRSPWRRRRTCRRSSTRCSGSGSTPRARCGASTAAWPSRIVLIVFSPAVSGSQDRR